MNTKAIRTTLFASSLLLLGSLAPAAAQVSIGIGLPHVNIGFNIPLYPEFERVPGYPVYYAPRLDANYFFYDGVYWVYRGDNWYASSWYNGPWGLVGPEFVPVYILRVPVRYYREPPRYFRRWQGNAPPRWGKHWGRDWEQRRRGWDQWDHSPRRPAPLPAYQREYSGDRYPQVDRQGGVRNEHYTYRPRNRVVRQHYETHRGQGARAPAPPDQRESQGSQQRQNPSKKAAPHRGDEHKGKGKGDS